MKRTDGVGARRPVLAIFAALAVACVLPAPVSAGVFLDINFSGQTDGNSVATSLPGPLPITDPYALGGFPNNPPFTGTTTVTNTHGFSNGALMSTAQAGTGANYMDTQFLVSAPLITLNFDINVLTIPVNQTSDGQVVPGAPNGQAFVVKGFSLAGQGIWRFIVTPDANGFLFGMRANVPTGDMIPLGTGPYNLGQTYHVSIAANYLTNTVNAYIDGVLLGNNLQFTASGPASVGMSEFFFFQNGVEGVDNQVILDNIVATTATVPEPGSLAVWSLVAGIFGVGALRRRRSSAAA